MTTLGETVPPEDEPTGPTHGEEIAQAVWDLIQSHQGNQSEKKKALADAVDALADSIPRDLDDLV